MTDIEARGYAEGELAKGASGPLGKFLRFALVAIKDRADLLEGALDLIQEECDEETKGGWMACRMRDAGLHMEGKG